MLLINGVYYVVLVDVILYNNPTTGKPVFILIITFLGGGYAKLGVSSLALLLAKDNMGLLTAGFVLGWAEPLGLKQRFGGYLRQYAHSRTYWGESTAIRALPLILRSLRQCA